MAFDLLERGMGTLGDAPAPVAKDPITQPITFEPDAEESEPAIAEAAVEAADETAVRRKPSLQEFVEEIPEKIEYNGEPPSERAKI